MAEEILAAHAERTSEMVIVPSSGGRFTVTAGGKTVYDKAKSGKFPDAGEVERLLAKAL